MYNTMFKDSIVLDLCKRVLDGLIVVLAAHVVSLLYLRHAPGGLPPVYSVVMYVSAALVFSLFPQFQLYTSWRGRPMHVMFIQLAMSWGLVVLICLLFSYLIHQSSVLSRLWMAYWFVAGAALLIIAIATKYSSPGPVFFKHIRHSLNGRKFKIYKFRGMKVHTAGQWDPLGSDILLVARKNS
jgi:small-conductance mechanosensitive channel